MSTENKTSVDRHRASVNVSDMYVIQLKGGTTLRMPKGRGPECVYDRLLGVLCECEVKVQFFPSGSEWQPGENALSAAFQSRITTSPNET